METLGLNVTDLVILFVIGSSGIISLFRGFTKEFLSLLLWIFAFFAAVGFEGYVTPKDFRNYWKSRSLKNHRICPYFFSFHCNWWLFD